ncbi:MAG: alpha/beta hydrolase family protein [Gammaproteobacteria bacterium]|nr:alpha/beta hydrolase family protein [Gammaproteobacteria bacterium]
MKTSIFRTLFLAASMLSAISVLASDYDKEKRWADQVVDSIMTGDAVWLEANGHKFLGIHTEPADSGKTTGVIMLHGVGVHPNWTDVVQPIRVGVSEAGWHTLSLQMPILANDAEISAYKPLFPEVSPRIDAGIEFLKARGMKSIVIVGHSLGATMGGYFVARHSGTEVKALIAIGASGLSFKDENLDFVSSLKKIKKPVLEITGSEDLPDVLQTMKLKAQSAKDAGNKHYRVARIAGANHFLVGKEAELVKTITDYLEQVGK